MGSLIWVKVAEPVVHQDIWPIVHPDFQLVDRHSTFSYFSVLEKGLFKRMFGVKENCKTPLTVTIQIVTEGAKRAKWIYKQQFVIISVLRIANQPDHIGVAANGQELHLSHPYLPGFTLTVLGYFDSDLLFG